MAAVVLGLVAWAAVGAGYYAMRAEGEAVRQADIAGQQKRLAEIEAALANPKPRARMVRLWLRRWSLPRRCDVELQKRSPVENAANNLKVPDTNP